MNDARPDPEARGRGAAGNPANRFEKLEIHWDWDGAGAAPPAPDTQFLRDASRTVLSRNDSPDLPFEYGLNPYRGCEHGCVYCYARPTHEYLGFSAGLDFETRILVKEDAPELLRRELAAPRWRPTTIALSGVTDPYQPVERQLGITRRCLAVLAEFRNPVAVVTKNQLVTRDLDLLGELALHDAAAVSLSITTLDAELSGRLEPRASRPPQRLAAITALRDAGVPVGVLAAPVIPGLNDHELPAILQAAAAAGAGSAGYVVLRLPHGVAGLFEDWLRRCLPGHKDKVMRRIRELRGGATNDPRFGSRMRGTGPYARRIHDLFTLGCARAGIAPRAFALSSAAFRRPVEQPRLF